ncbi:YebC/PmpR family DNA-binding transcriptional regulator [Candidatus Babeliales bacterium]|nr:YebC/PmpR family DNA-binding transcriptional regulator [Candidatus Babeliales bacterium]
MAGHSKWANIKHKKAKEDAKRGKIFTRLIKEITVVARDGGGDLSANAKLRLLVEKAKAANMPKDNIERAIKKGTGELEGATYEAATYEGYGPKGLALIVQVLTDNKNRSVSELRHYFAKHGGHMAESGAVAWMFENKGVLEMEVAGHDEDEIMEKLLEAGIDDVKMLDEVAMVTCEPKDLDIVKIAAEKSGFKVQNSELRWLAKEPLEILAEDEAQVFKFLDGIEDLDDVQNMYANVE